MTAAVLAGAAQLPAGAAASAPAGALAPPGAAAAGGSWRTHSIVRLNKRLANALVDPSANAVFELLARAAGGPYQLRRVGLTSKSVRRGPYFPDDQLSLADGYVWVSGVIARGRDYRLVLYQVSRVTLRVVRSWRLTGEFRIGGGSSVPVAAGPARTVWVGFRRSLWRLSTRTGAVVARARLRSGLSVDDVAVDPARTHLYVSVAPTRGGAALREYSATSGRLLAAATRPVRDSVVGARLTAVPGAVWASFRTGMDGETVLARQRGLRQVHLAYRPGLFSWAMFASTAYGGGSVWLATNGGTIGCLAPASGHVRSRATLKSLADTGFVLGVSAARHRVYLISPSNVVLGVTAPARCWR